MGFATVKTRDVHREYILLDRLLWGYQVVGGEQQPTSSSLDGVHRINQSINQIKDKLKHMLRGRSDKWETVTWPQELVGWPKCSSTRSGESKIGFRREGEPRLYARLLVRDVGLTLNKDRQTPESISHSTKKESISDNFMLIVLHRLLSRTIMSCWWSILWSKMDLSGLVVVELPLDGGLCKCI
jgi:hypothetical protein